MEVYSNVMQKHMQVQLTIVICVLIKNSTGRTAIILSTRISKFLVNNKIAYEISASF